MFKNKSKTYIIVWLLCVILMMASIGMWIYAIFKGEQMYSPGLIPGGLQRIKHNVLGTNYAVSNGNAGNSVLLSVILYTVVGIRNRNTTTQLGNLNAIDIPAIILHILNILFLTSVFNLTDSAEIFGFSSSQFIMVGIITTLLGMKSISGFIWILCTLCLICSARLFNMWSLAIPYVIFGYMSIIFQIFTIRIFEFDIEQLKNDILGGKEIMKNVVIRDIKESIDVSKSTIQKASKMLKK